MAKALPTKWQLCEIHLSGSSEPPFFVSLPQYGPWDDESDAREMGQVLMRLEPRKYQLDVRQFDDGKFRDQVSKVAMDSIATSPENSPPDLHDTAKGHYQGPLRWQSRIQHD